MNKRVEIPIIRKRETPAPQVHVSLFKYLISDKKPQISVSKSRESELLVNV